MKRFNVLSIIKKNSISYLYNISMQTGTLNKMYLSDFFYMVNEIQ